MYNKTRQNFRVIKTSLDLKRPLPSASSNLSFLITRNILRDVLWELLISVFKSNSLF